MSEVHNISHERDKLKAVEKWPTKYINLKDFAAADFYYYPTDTERFKTAVYLQIHLMIECLAFLLPRQGLENQRWLMMVFQLWNGNRTLATC